MSVSVLNRPARAAAPRPGARRSPTAALLLLASIVVSFLAASAAPTPLYAVYQAEWGFSPITTTVVFGIYAIAVLAALLTFGKLSDHLGRRPVLLAAIAVQIAAMVVFATAPGVTALIVARVVQGLSTGAAVGAVGAGLLDVDRVRGTFANALAPGIGTATGALVSGLVVAYLPAPTRLIYLALIVVFAAQAAGVAVMRETVTPAPGALASLRPEIKLPRGVRGAVLTAAPVMFAVWALAGFYGSLGPALIRQLVGGHSVVQGGLGLFVLAGSAVLAVLALRHAPARQVMMFGIAALLAGVTVTLLGIAAGSAAWFFVGTVIAGAGFGSGFQGGIRTVLPLVAPHERAGVLSLLYIVSYLGLGAPAVIAGYLVVHDGGLLATAREYGIGVMILAALALLGMTVKFSRSAAVASSPTDRGGRRSTRTAGDDVA
jgi:MFS family permease